MKNETAEIQESLEQGHLANEKSVRQALALTQETVSKQQSGHFHEINTCFVVTAIGLFGCGGVLRKRNTDVLQRQGASRLTCALLHIPLMGKRQNINMKY